MAAIKDQEQFDKAVAALKSGQFDADPEVKAGVLAAVQDFQRRTAATAPELREPVIPEPEPPNLASRGIIGALETAGSLASALPASLAGGTAGILSLANEDSPETAAGFVESGSSKFRFEPRTQLGKQLLGGVQTGLGAADTFLTDTAAKPGNPFSPISLPPLAATGTKAALETIPGAIGLKRAQAPVLSRAAREGAPIPSLTAVQDLARQGNERGFVFNPKDVKGGVVSATEGIAGAPKLNQQLSSKNMRPTTQLANEQIGLRSNPKSPTRLDRDVLETHIRQKGKAYEAVTQHERFFLDNEFATEYASAMAKLDEVVREAPDFAPSKTLLKRAEALRPGSGSFSFSGTVADQMIKRLRQDANTAFKKGKDIEGFAFRDLGQAFERMVERNMDRAGKSGAVAEMQAARKNIAQTYSYLGALGERGGIIPRKLAAQRAAGRPLTGNAKFIADLADAFPEQMRNVSAPAALSEFEGLAGFSGALAGGSIHPAGFALPAFIAAKPLVRGAIASPFGQRLNFPGPSHPAVLPGLIASGALAQQGLLDPRLAGEPITQEIFRQETGL